MGMEEEKKIEETKRILDMCCIREPVISNILLIKLDSELQIICGKAGETVSHIESHIGNECGILAQRQWKRKYCNIRRILHQMLCGKCKQEITEKWYDLNALGVVGNGGKTALGLHRDDNVIMQLKQDYNREGRQMVLDFVLGI